MNLAKNITENIAIDLIYKEKKKMKSKLKGSALTFKPDKKPKYKLEAPIISVIDKLEISKYKCCKKKAKIKPLTKLIGSYCPICGVNYN